MNKLIEALRAEVAEWRTRVPGVTPSTSRIVMREWCADRIDAILKAHAAESVQSPEGPTIAMADKANQVYCDTHRLLLFSSGRRPMLAALGAIWPSIVEATQSHDAEAAQAQAQDAKDAARYQWLRDDRNYPDRDWWTNELEAAVTPDQFDNAIDAAMAKESGR